MRMGGNVPAEGLRVKRDRFSGRGKTLAWVGKSGYRDFPREVSNGEITPLSMKLVSLLSERRVVPELKAETHWDALSELVEHLIATGYVEEDGRERVLAALHDREEQVSTGIGHGVAIPHAYCDRLEQPVAVLGRSREGVDFEACDNAPVHFVLLLLVPRSQPHVHLQTLASIAKLFSQCEVRRQLKEAVGGAGILGVLSRCEAQAA